MTGEIYSRLHESPLIINAMLRKLSRKWVPEIDPIKLTAKGTVANNCFDSLAYLRDLVPLLAVPDDRRWHAQMLTLRLGIHNEQSGKVVPLR
jgi:hypothetical protein